MAHASTTGTAPAPAPAPTAVTAPRAAAQAKSTGKAVPVDAATTTTDQLTANPDGSFTLNQALAPVRKHTTNGWKPLDATLVKRSDGSIGPALTTSDLTLSGGGSGALASMKSAGRTLSVTLPASLTKNLPAPALDGPTATYALLTGVDLKVTADQQGGFSEVLVVKDATAAANPALKSLAFTTKTSGVDLAADAAGNISARDKQGRTVFSAPAPVKGVWDSAVDTNAPTVTDPTTGTKVDAHSGAPALSSASEPGATAHTAPLAAGLSSGTITLTPDPALLSGQNTVWPLYIDPTYASAGSSAQAWTYVNSHYGSTSYWHTSDSTGLRVGYNGWESPYYVGRTYTRMNVPSSIYGAQVTSSRFYATETWSASCTAKPVELWWTGAISDTTTWNNQPGWISRLDTKTVANGWSNDCPAASVGFDTTSVMQTAANNNSVDVTLALKASDESDSLGWKKFQPSTMYMSTTYNHAPNTPSQLVTSPSTACDASTPTVVGNGDVTLFAAVSDPDGGSLGVGFNLVNTTTGQSIASSSTGSLYATSGTSSSLNVTRDTLAKSAAGQPTTFAWNVYASDGITNGPTSTTCRFTFDVSVPGRPGITQNTTTYKVGADASFTFTANPSAPTPSSYLYQLNGAAPQTVTASAGNATVTLKPTRRVNTLTVTAVSVGGNIGDSAVLPIDAAAPATAPENDFTGQGRADLTVVGKTATLPPGLWLSSGISTSTLNTAADNIGVKGNLLNTPGSPADWNTTQAIAGHFASGDGFNDILDYNPATGTASVLFGNGDGSAFTADAGTSAKVADKVFTTAAGSKATQVANGGALYNTLNDVPVNGFPALILLVDNKLQVEQASVSPGAFAGASAAIDVTTTSPTGTGSWAGWTITTTLVGGLPALFTRNDTSGALYYYSPQNLMDLTGGTGAPTPLKLADSGWNAAAKPVIQAADINRDGTPDLWSVDSTGKATANLFNGTTLATQANQPLTAPTHAWPLGDNTVDQTTHILTAQDTVGTATLSGPNPDATYSSQDLFNPDVHLNGTTGALTTTTPAVTANTSFTLSAWAKPDTTSGTVLSQDGNHTAGISLYADPTTKQWYFCMATADTATPTYDCAHPAPGSGTVQTGAWTHLTATYDSTTTTMTLYVNGVSAGTKTHTPVTGFTGKLRTGNALHADTYDTYYKGALSTIQAWNGTALTAAQTAALSGTPGYILSPGASVKNSLSSRCLFVSWRTPDNGAPAQQYDCDATFTDQLFKIEPVTGGGYQLRNVFNNRCLFVSYTTPGNNVPVTQYDCNPAFTDQVWYLDPVTGGGYQLRNGYSNRCMYIPWSTPGPGAAALVYDCNPAFADQVWKI
ncbi:RICIN domain-containing protein [Kitasatospora paracochleata]|uniref:LamG-like jellyroll fold domain-containing protein n=1 Tax=Kitasatospora paracochleata TaxID=58354 RepID=A0ABT1J0D6_9ACTN|nr:RICIN domain-containing protein [Kitasatospora paracochleata]MCP2310869.1 hypothetical protein [Kitasatospora paracochleata]